MSQVFLMKKGLPDSSVATGTCCAARGTQTSRQKHRSFLIANCSLHSSFLPKSPVYGRANPAGFGAAESGTCEGGFRRVFGRGLERPAGRADADAQFPGNDLP